MVFFAGGRIVVGTGSVLRSIEVMEGSFEVESGNDERVIVK